MILPNHSWTLKCHRKSLSCGFQCFLYTSGLRKGRRTQNEKDVFIRAFWTGDHWKIVKGTIQGSSYLRRSECSRVTVHMLDSHVDHQDHSSVRSLAVLGRAGWMSKKRCGWQPVLGSSPLYSRELPLFLPISLLKRKKEPGFCFVLVVTDRQPMFCLRVPLFTIISYQRKIKAEIKYFMKKYALPAKWTASRNTELTRM